MTDSEIRERLVLTVHLARDYQEFPTLPKVLVRQLYDQPGFVFLPHIQRNKTQRLIYDNPLKKYLAGRKAFEITRYVAFEKNIPFALHALMMLKALESARTSENSSDIVIASVDENSGPRYENIFNMKYIPGVSEFIKDMPINPETGRPNEYRLFLEFNSTEYKELKDRLERISGRITF